MKLYNTLTRRIDRFRPLNPPLVTLYTCGPTVYDYTHIGHMRKFIGDDVLKRSLRYLGYTVRHIMNITDVGHLTSDEDAGEDKLEKGARKTGKTVWEVAKFYTDFFFETMDSVAVERPDTVAKATDHIDDMVSLAKRLVENGHAYETPEAVYFDVTTFPTYGCLSGQKLEDKIKGAREETYVDPAKRHPADFALWFKRTGRFADHTMHWPSPWGEGFPGWHIECSAMSMKYLGDTIDIHTGGIDHVPVHHENEIAQSEAATGHPFVRYWVHHAFLQVDGEKMSKSLGNFYTIADIRKQNIEPLAIRLLFFQTHYRQPTNFTWTAAHSAQTALSKLRTQVSGLAEATAGPLSEQAESFRAAFGAALGDDLQMPRAIAVLWDMLKSDIPSGEKRRLALGIDEVLGLGLATQKEEKIPDAIMELAQQRNAAKINKDFATADRLRDEIAKRGFVIEDTKKGFALTRKHSNS